MRICKNRHIAIGTKYSHRNSYKNNVIRIPVDVKTQCPIHNSQESLCHLGVVNSQELEIIKTTSDEKEGKVVSIETSPYAFVRTLYYCHLL